MFSVYENQLFYCALLKRCPKNRAKQEKAYSADMIEIYCRNLPAIRSSLIEEEKLMGEEKSFKNPLIWMANYMVLHALLIQWILHY